MPLLLFALVVGLLEVIGLLLCYWLLLRLAGAVATRIVVALINVKTISLKQKRLFTGR